MNASVSFLHSIKWNDASIIAIEEMLTLRLLIFGILKMMCCFLGYCCIFLCVVWDNTSHNRFVFGLIMLCRQCWFWMKFTPQGFLLHACLISVFIYLFIIYLPRREKELCESVSRVYFEDSFFDHCVFFFFFKISLL